MGYFEFLDGTGIIYLSLNIQEKLHWQHLFEKSEEAETHCIYLSQYKAISIHPEEQYLPFKQTGTTTIFLLGYQSCVWLCSEPFFWQNPCSGGNSGIDLVVTLEYTFFQLCSNAKQISVRLARFKRSYVKHPAFVLTSPTSYTAFFLDVPCAFQSGYVPFLQLFIPNDSVIA